MIDFLGAKICCHLMIMKYADELSPSVCFYPLFFWIFSVSTSYLVAEVEPQTSILQKQEQPVKLLTSLEVFITYSKSPTELIHNN